MNRMLGLAAVVAAVLGFWAGVSAWQQAGVGTNILAGVAILIGGNLLLCVWLWRRAQPGSGDAMVLPTVVVLSAAMLLGILPRLFWPAAEGLQIAGSIASVLVMTVVVVIQIRNRRRLRRGTRPA
jgi:FtsH-binding integral membrane protein